MRTDQAARLRLLSELRKIVENVAGGGDMLAVTVVTAQPPTNGVQGHYFINRIVFTAGGCEGPAISSMVEGLTEVQQSIIETYGIGAPATNSVRH